MNLLYDASREASLLLIVWITPVSHWKFNTISVKTKTRRRTNRTIAAFVPSESPDGFGAGADVVPLKKGVVKFEKIVVTLKDGVVLTVGRALVIVDLPVAVVTAASVVEEPFLVELSVVGAVEDIPLVVGEDFVGDVVDCVLGTFVESFVVPFVEDVVLGTVVVGACVEVARGVDVVVILVVGFDLVVTAFVVFGVVVGLTVVLGLVLTVVLALVLAVVLTVGLTAVLVAATAVGVAEELEEMLATDS